MGGNTAAKITHPDDRVPAGDDLSWETLASAVANVSAAMRDITAPINPDRAVVRLGIDVEVESGVATRLVLVPPEGAGVIVTLEWNWGRVG